MRLIVYRWTCGARPFSYRFWIDSSDWRNAVSNVLIPKKPAVICEGHAEARLEKTLQVVAGRKVVNGRICVFHLCALGSETTRTTGKNNFEEVRGRGALRLLRSSRSALTQPDRFATGASTRPRFFCLLHIVFDGFLI